VSLSSVARRATIYAQSLLDQAAEGGGAPAPKAETITGAAGPVYKVARLLGSSSILSLISGSSNLSLAPATGVISATLAVAAGSTQKVLVREVSGEVAIEYPITLTGQQATPTPVPSFTALPAVEGSITAGQAIAVLTFTDGGVAHGAVTARSYLLAGAPVASNYVTKAADAGKEITFRNTATGTNGSTIQAVSTTSVVIAAAGLPTPQPTFTPATTTAGFPAEPQAYAMGA
jgi:hypothetical protein